MNNDVSEKLKAIRIKHRNEWDTKTLSLARKFNNLMMEFKCLEDEAVDYVCSLLSTSSVASIYQTFLEPPHVYTLNQIYWGSRYSNQTTLKAIKKLLRFNVIIEKDNLYALTLEELHNYEGA